MARATVLSKEALRAELLAHLTAAHAAAAAAHASAIEGATHEEARPENDKDTRGLEQSYLARGQAQRVAELELAVAETTVLALRTFGPAAPIAMSAVVTVREASSINTYFIAPHGGGHVLKDGVQVLTPSSPLGRTLLGKCVDDEAQLQLPGKLRTLVITSIR